jgi:type VI secretion system protein ImpA
MPLGEDLLAPIAGDNPSGPDLRYDPVYEKLKEARREEDDVAQGVWEHERKVADWKLYRKLATEFLAKRSKDLQVAAWLVECLIHQEGFAGLKEGLDFVRALMDTFWDTMYPELEDGDADLRSVPIQFIASRLDLPLRRVPLAGAVNWFTYKESTTVPSEQEAGQDYKKSEVRQAALADGKTTPEMIDEAIKGETKERLEGLREAVKSAAESVEEMASFSEQRFGEYSPGFGPLKECLEQIDNALRILIQRKGGGRPAQPAARQPEPQYSQPEPQPSSPAPSSDDPWASYRDIEPEPEAEQAQATAEPQPTQQASTDDWLNTYAEPETQGAQEPAAPARPAFGTPAGIASDEDAASHVAAAARWLRQEHAVSPASYLMLRGFRWGELRAAQANGYQRLLAAPSTEIRQNLKALFQESNWEALLESAEEAMAQPCGRGWLDLQRYTLLAMRELGDAFGPARACIRQALQALLADFPTLPQAVLDDDTPAATRQTSDFLREEGLCGELAQRVYGAAAQPEDDDAPVRAALKEGRFDQALALVSARMARETSGRGRFQARCRLAQILAGANRQSVALPILRELAREVFDRQLDQWEPASIVVEPLLLLYKSLGSSAEDADERLRIHTAVCRLDPVRALELR